MPYTVITADEELPPFPAMARILAAARGLDTDTAAREARHCWGLLGSGLDEAAAERLEEACAGAGVRARRLDSGALPALPPPSQPRKLVFEGGGALFTAETGPLACRQEDIAVLAAAPVKEETSRKIKITEGPSTGEKALRAGIMAVTGLPIGLGKSREVKRDVKSSETSFYLDILLAGGRARLRLTSDSMDFSCLKEKKTYSSQVNFRLLCAELAVFSPEAARNSGLRALLAGSPLAALPYDSLADLERETLRLLLARVTA